MTWQGSSLTIAKETLSTSCRKDNFMLIQKLILSEDSICDFIVDSLVYATSVGIEYQVKLDS